MLTKVGSSLPAILMSILIFALFWFLAKFCTSLIQRLALKSTPQKQPVFLVFTIATRIAILLVGAITALGSAGVNVSAMVASLGLSGLAIGLASKDAFSNLMAGIMVLLYQPFKIGDNIQVGEHNGTVTKMSLRYTHLQGDNKEILIPNASLLTNNIIICGKI
ncbi:mechanosensitive ion channel family protein [Candidatus Berkiella aquae]|nr:mechanosensitive ion channel domain-containing protein [Candidatus Berkiella aquae]MCS5712119.1 mechanosensitive ion channel family protein [Candidatus Berkiella aquae]